MRVMLDTRDVPPAQRFDFWMEGTSRIFFPLDIRARSERPFVGNVLGSELGPVTAFRVSGDANACRRTHSGIGAHDPEHVQLHIVRRGRCHYTQADRAGTLGCGDMTTCDSSHPFTILADPTFELVIYSFPRQLLGPHTERITARTALRMPGSNGLANLVRPFLYRLVEQVDDSAGDAAGHELSASLVALLRALHSAPPTDALDVRRPIAVGLLRRIEAFIDLHIGEVDLSPERIARAHFISIRYLHKLFELEGITVSTWIRQRRLDGCRRDLLDPALSDRTIAQIATCWGLTDAARLSRLFRSAYGCSPRELREQTATEHASPVT